MSMHKIPLDIQAVVDDLYTAEGWSPSYEAVCAALLYERERATAAERERWKASDEAGRESGLMLDPFDVAAAVMAERERIARKADKWAADLEAFKDKGPCTMMREFAKSIRTDTTQERTP